MTGPRIVPSVLLALAFAFACSSTHSPSGPEPISYDTVFSVEETIQIDGEPDASVDYVYNATYSNGRFYLPGVMTNRILTHKPAEDLSEWGGAGQGPGEFVFPYGVSAVSPDSVFVIDRGNRRIQVFDTMHRPLLSFPVNAENEDIGVFRNANGHLIVRVVGYGLCNDGSGTGCVIRDYASDGTFLRDAHPVESTSISVFSWSASIGADGTTYVTNREGDVVHQYDADGVKRAEWIVTSPSQKRLSDTPLSPEERTERAASTAYTGIDNLVHVGPTVYVLRQRYNMDDRPTYVIDVLDTASNTLYTGAETNDRLADAHEARLLFRSPLSDSTDYGRVTLRWVRATLPGA